MSDNIITLDMSELAKLRSKITQLDDISLMAADNAVANLGAEGRKIVGKLQETVVPMGKIYTKWNASSKTYETKSHARMDTEHGWYKSTGKRGIRLMGFKFENASYSKRATKKSELSARLGAMSLADFTSNITNLFYKPVHYSKNSPSFVKDGYGWHKWHKGATRPAKNVGLEASMLQKGMQPAIDRTVEFIDKELIKGGWK